MIRFAIWAAVSSKPQAADDKVSLADQEKQCRGVALGKGWLESSGPYVVPGESRTRWVNLRDAEEAIPALHQMLDSAQRGEFDVLVLWNYNRLRELLDPVARTLGAYRVQLYALSQPVEPQPPDTYDPIASDTANTMQFMSGFTSRAETQEFRRKYKTYMPLRIKLKGLPKGRVPYGFRKPPGRELDPDAVPIADPDKAAAVIKMKDLFLAGQSLKQIARQLNDEGIRTPRAVAPWRDVNVRQVLLNRFYGGEVFFGRQRRISDPRTGTFRIVPNDPARMIVAKGAHQPLWDSATQARLEAEWKRRGKKWTGVRTLRLSNLLYCGICGARVWVYYPGGYTDSHRRWICHVNARHVSLKDDVLLPRVITQLTQALQQTEGVAFPEPEDRRPLLLEALADLQARLERLTDALEAGTLDAITYGGRSQPLERRLAEIQREIEQADDSVRLADRRREARQTLAVAVETAPDFLQQAPAQLVNAQLCQLLEKIVITPDAVKFVFR